MKQKTFQKSSVVLLSAIFVLLFAFTSVAEESGQGYARVIFNLEVPADTPEDANVYITGNIAELGKLSPTGLLMKEDLSGIFVAEIKVPLGTKIEYKYTRGSEKSIECSDEGDEIPYRTLTVTKDGEEIEDTVVAWADKIIRTAKTIEDARKLWVEYYNAQSRNLVDFYADEAMLYIPDQKIARGKEIVGFLRSAQTYVGSIKEVKPIGLYENGENRYFELGYFTSNSKNIKKVFYITSWVRRNGNWYCNLNVFYPHSDLKNASEAQAAAAIEKRVREWVKLANEHDSTKVLENLYTKNCNYFGNGNLVVGRKNVADAFNYMSDPNYSIDLSTVKLALVAPDIAFEIGRYKTGGFTGLYTVVWRKDKDAKWWMDLDSD